MVLHRRVGLSQVWLCAMALALSVDAAGCSAKPVPTYKPGAVPGVTQQRLEEIEGKPTGSAHFTLPGVDVQALTYPFGQAVVRSGKVIVVIIASDPAYVGPYGTHLGMSEDQLKAGLTATHKHRSGHRDSYDVIAGDTVTRTKDLYDETDRVMYELAAANANDPLAPYYIVSINLADADGFGFLTAVTQAKVSGLYPGERIDNFISEPWSL